MKVRTNPVMGAVQDPHPVNQGVAAAIPPAQARHLMSAYDEEWVAFVIDHADRKCGNDPDGGAVCPRVWNLPHECAQAESLWSKAFLAHSPDNLKTRKAKH